MNIQGLSTGTVKIKTKHLRGQGNAHTTRTLNLFTDPHWSDPLPIHVWVIDHPEGIILVDAGDTADQPPGWQHPFHTLATRKHVRPQEEILPQLGALGIKADDVRWVVLTHLHIDHDGGLKSFPQAEFIVAAGEHAKAKGTAGRIGGYVPQRWPEWWQPRLINFVLEPFGPFERSLRLTKAGDVVLVPTPGHTSHHLSVIAQEDGISYFFAGDTSYTQQLMLDGVVDGVSPDAGEAKQTLQRIRQFAETRPTVYLPTHDPLSAARLEERQTVPLAQQAEPVFAK